MRPPPGAESAPGTQLWVRRYNGPVNGYDYATSTAVSPGGRRVFVTGYSERHGTGLDFATVGYNAVTGARLWVKRYNGPGNGDDFADAVAVSPSGSRVFVTGTSPGPGSASGSATIAYNAVTGAKLWVHRSTWTIYRVAVSPSGGTVFVTGNRPGPNFSVDYATVAYSAATGATLWARGYNGPANNVDFAQSIAVGPGTVFVTGVSVGLTSHADYATVAYNALTGAQLWVSRYNGPANGNDDASAVAVSPGGGTVFVTGTSQGATSQYDYATVAYDAATGAQLWAQRYNGTANNYDAASSLAVSPSGGTVFVTGASEGATTGSDYATVAYDAATGAQLWVARYDLHDGAEQARAIAVSPGGGTVYVTGIGGTASTHEDYATVAYDAATGAQLWVRLYNGPGNKDDVANSLAVSPTTGTVFVTGSSRGTRSSSDYATIAYSG